MFKKFIFIFSVIFIFSHNCVIACSVPVFRYALERWGADPYPVVLFHKGEFNEEQKKVIELLNKYQEEKGSIILRIVDVDKEDPEELKPLLEGVGKDKLPVLVVRYPFDSRIPSIASTLPLEMQEVNLLLESPARRELVRRIIKGDSSVFIQIDGEDEKENIETEKSVKAILVKMQEKLQLPHKELSEGEVLDEESMAYDKTMQIKFSILRISRKDPNEKYFLKMLLNSEEDLNTYKTPIIIPTYGRARGLYAFLEKGITEDNLFEVGAFITGACSCEIKAVNPGFDLLVSVVWDDLIFDTINIDEALPPLTGIAAFAEKGDNAPIEKVDLNKVAQIDEPSDDGKLLVNMMLTIIVLLVAFVLILWVMKRKKPVSK